MMADFNSGEVKMGVIRSRTRRYMGDRLMELIMNNLTMQWVQDKTKYREEDEPFRHDLKFTKRMGLKIEVNCTSPLGKSDHVCCTNIVQSLCKRHVGRKAYLETMQS